MLKNVIVFSLIFLICLNVRSQDSYLMAVNGSQSYARNYDSFEDDLLSVGKLYPESQRKILNSDGKNAQFLITESSDRFRFVDFLNFRNSEASVSYRSTKIPESIGANKLNILSTAQIIADKKPKKVTLLYSNHGAKTGPSVLDGILTVKDIEAIDDIFDTNTLVQRIHLHCYSGAMIDHNNSKSAIYAIKSVEQLKKYFKKNRCALSDATSFEYSTDTQVEDYLNKKPKASLQDLYSFLRTDNYSADPVLTSVFFLEIFAHLECGKTLITEGTVCSHGCDEKLSEACSNIKESYDNLKLKRYALKYVMNKEFELFENYKQDEISKNHKATSDLYSQSLDRYQKYLTCKEIGIMKDVVKSCPKDLEKEYASLSEGLKQYESLSEKLHGDIKFYEKFYESMGQNPEFIEDALRAGQISGQTSVTSDENGVPSIHPKSLVEAEIRELLSKEKSSPTFTASLLKHDSALNAMIPFLKKHPELYELYQSVKACEEKPVGPLTK